MVSKAIDIPYESKVLDEEIADHLIISISLKKEAPTTIKQITIRYNKITPDNIIKLREKLNLVDWSNSDDITVNTHAEKLVTIIKEKLDESCPIIERRINKNKDPLNNWITQEILEKRRKKANELGNIILVHSNLVLALKKMLFV